MSDKIPSKVIICRRLKGAAHKCTFSTRITAGLYGYGKYKTIHIVFSAPTIGAAAEVIHAALVAEQQAATAVRPPTIFGKSGTIILDDVDADAGEGGKK